MVSLDNNHQNALQTILQEEQERQRTNLRAILKDKAQGGVPSYPTKVFPTFCQNFIQAYCECFGCAPEHYGTAMLTVAGAAIGNSLHVIERGTTHPPIIWGVITDPPSVGKTPIMNTVVRPFWALEKGYQERYAEAKKVFDAAIKAGQDAQQPRLQELILNDTTVEAVLKMLHANQRGGMYLMDEISRLLFGMGRYSKGGGGAEESFYLEAFMGNPTKVSRSKDNAAPMVIERVFLSMLGGTQPGIIQHFGSGNRTQSGFMARFIFSYPDNSGKQEYRTIQPDRVFAQKWEQLVRLVYSIPFAPELFEDSPTPYIVELEPDAARLYQDWYNNNVRDINESEDETVKGILGKFDTYVLRFALVLEVLWFAEEMMNAGIEAFEEADREKIKVGTTAMHGAIALQKYYRATALKVVNRLSGPHEALPEKQRAWYLALPDGPFTRAQAAELGREAGFSIPTVDRLLRNVDLFKKLDQGAYSKKY